MKMPINSGDRHLGNNVNEPAALVTMGKGLSLGGSLSVPNVQELASAGNLSEVPARYIRPKMESEVVEDGGAKWTLPVVDFDKLLGESAGFQAEEATKLSLACQEWGFFLLVNHGVPDGLIKKMTADLELFFAQPLEDKMASSRQPADSVEGYGQAFVVSEEQKLDWADMLYLVAQPLELRNLSLWPTHPLSFRETIDEYSREMKRVSQALLVLMAESLGLNPEKLIDRFTRGKQGLRMNYYPPCPAASRVLGISPHSDPWALTILLNASPTPGLQIRKDGRWVAVRPISGAFIVNVGDILEIMTNGKFKSIEHRAVVHKEKKRLSVAAFYAPNIDALVGPLPDLVGGARPLYKTISTEELFRQFFSKKLEGKKLLESLKHVQ